MKKLNYYGDILKELTELKKEYPNMELGTHISMATSEYKDLWGISDKEILHLIQKYRLTLESDIMPNEDYIDKIIKDGMNLDTILDEDEDDQWNDDFDM